MARDERGMGPENTARKKLGGRPSKEVPGKMQITTPLGDKPNRSAARYADAMPFGASDKGGNHKYDGK